MEERELAWGRGAIPERPPGRRAVVLPQWAHWPRLVMYVVITTWRPPPLNIPQRSPTESPAPGHRQPGKAAGEEGQGCACVLQRSFPSAPRCRNVA